MSTASEHCGSVSSACGWGCNAPTIPGSRGLTPWTLRPKRLQWLNNLSGKLTVPPASYQGPKGPCGCRTWTPCDLGLCKCKPKAKTAAPVLCGFKPFFPERSFPRQGATSRHPPPFYLFARPPSEFHRNLRGFTGAAESGSSGQECLG